LAEIDQAASESDQAASDRDLEQGGDAAVHDASRDVRDRGAKQREHSTRARLDTATERDLVAGKRDLVGSARDAAASRQDRDLASEEAFWGAQPHVTTREKSLIRRFETSRGRAAADRADAAAGRRRAADDRKHAAADRLAGVRELAQLRADREVLREQLAEAETDVLTGARARGPGLRDLEAEIDRARRRTPALLTVAYFDVVGLKAVNDTRGHGSGDALLQCAVATVRRHLRSYDMIARLGGDEFLCVLSGATLEEAAQRFVEVDTALASGRQRCEITVGLAGLEPADTATTLVQRADAKLARGSQR
jgi:diguanylate cyclase (GGDEF)-like protein